MPIKKKDWAKILQGLAQAAQIPYQVQQLKEAQARQADEDWLRKNRIEEIKARTSAQADAAKAQTDVASLLKMANMQGPVSVPFPGGGGGMEYQPAPEGILSGVTNSLLEQAYQRAYGKSVPENLRIQDKPYPSASKILTERKAQGELGVMPKLESQMPEPTETQKTINAYMRSIQGKATPEDKIRMALHPMPQPRTSKKLTAGNISSVWNVASRKFKKEEWLDKSAIDAVREINREGRRIYPEIWIDQTAPYEVTTEFRPWYQGDVKETIYLTPNGIDELKKAEKDLENNVITPEAFRDYLTKLIASEQ